MLTGEDAQFLHAIVAGAAGGILASAHAGPAAFTAVAEAIAQGRLADANQRWDRLSDLVRVLFAEPNPAPIKHLLWRRGLIASPELRLPMTGVGGALAAMLDDATAGSCNAN